MQEQPQPTDEIQDAILLIENDVLARAALAEYLRLCGYRVVEAASADEAMKLLSQNDPEVDVLLSEVEVPGTMDGFSLAKWVHSHKPEVRVILTGNVQKTANAAGELCDEGPYLRKPFKPEELVAWIKRLRENR